MKRLGKLTLKELKPQMLVMNSYEANSIIGGSSTDANGVTWWTQQECDLMIDQGIWTGGYVENTGYISSATNCYGSQPSVNTGTLLSIFGLGADAMNAPISISRSALGDSGMILKGFTRTGLVIGVIAGGVPAAYRIFDDLCNGTPVEGEDLIAITLAALGIACEYTGLGECWDAVALISAGTVAFDVYTLVNP